MRISDGSSDVCSSDLGIVDAWRNPFPLSVDHMRYDACTADQDVRLGLEEAATVVRGQAEQPAALQRDREAGSHQRPCDLAPYIIFEEGVHLEEHGDTAARAAEIGRASRRERVCQYVWISVVAGSIQKKSEHHNYTNTS